MPQNGLLRQLAHPYVVGQRLPDVMLMEKSYEKYRALRQRLSARMTFFDDVRTLMRYLEFASWDSLISDFLPRQTRGSASFD